MKMQTFNKQLVYESNVRFDVENSWSQEVEDMSSQIDC